MGKTEELPRWDLTNVYPALDSQEFKKASKEFIKQIEGLDAYLAEHGIASTNSKASEEDVDSLAAAVAGLLDRLNEALALAGTLYAYIASYVTTDSYNSDAKKIQSEWEGQYVRMQQQDTEIQAWLGNLGAKLDDVIAQNETAAAHAFYLREMAEQSKYLMTGPEEALAAELALSGGRAWGKLQGTVVSQLKAEFEVDGKTDMLPMTMLINLKFDPDEKVRRKAYETENAAWETVLESLAGAMNGVKGHVTTLNQKRGREDAIHESIDQSRIDRGTLEAMLGAMKASFPMFRKYFKAKAKRFGKESLAWWDVFAPVGNNDRRFTYPEACDFVVQQFGEFSPKLADYAQKAFDNNWIDVGPRDGKRAGAFCMGIPAVKESRILLNFDGTLDWVFTIAHELGHGFHNECAKDKTELQTVTPMTLAETASIMCETIVTNAVIAHAGSPEEELSILETSLIGDAQVVVDIYSRYLFETEVFERRAKAELSADDLNDIMKRAQMETYGDGLDADHLQPYMWTWKPHYYSVGRSFYNYPYAFGLLFATGLYAIYQERGEAFVADYVDLLASTGEANAADLAARFGIDIRTSKFWEDSLNVIGQRIERYVSL